MKSIVFIVDGEPVPKQSFRAVKGGGYTSPRVKAWQETVSYRAREAMQGNDPLTGPVSMQVVFTLGNRRWVDLDNLNKAICDACNGIIFEDDHQVVNLHLAKRWGGDPGVLVTVYPDIYPDAGE